MTLVDANLPIHASYVESRQHKAAKEWLEECFNGDTRVGLPWESLVAYVRIIANPRIFERPLDIDQALRQVEAWLENTAPASGAQNAACSSLQPVV